MASSSCGSSSSEGGRKLWIGNLDPKVTEYQLLKLVEPFGKISKLDFVYSLNGRGERVPRGFAFVTFVESTEAQSAIRHLHGVSLLGRNLHVRLATSSVGSSGIRKRTLEECRRDAKGPDTDKEEKIRALETKLKLMQQQEEKFKLAIPSVSVSGSTATKKK